MMPEPDSMIGHFVHGGLLSVAPSTVRRLLLLLWMLLLMLLLTPAVGMVVCLSSAMGQPSAGGGQRTVGWGRDLLLLLLREQFFTDTNDRGLLNVTDAIEFGSFAVALREEF